MDNFLDSVNISASPNYVNLNSTVNLVNVPGLGVIFPSLLLLATILLGFIEAKIKLDDSALRILLNKDKHSFRKVLLVNFAQTVLMLSVVHLKQTTPELKAVSFYVLMAKLILCGRRPLMVDLPGILATMMFLLLVRIQSTLSVIEYLDNLLIEVTLAIIPMGLTCLMALLLPVILPLAIITLLLTLVGAVLWMIVLLRRKYTEDFDLLVTVAIAVLMSKIARKELVQRQVKSIVCSKLPPPQLYYSGIGSSQIDYDPGLDRVLRWCSLGEEPQLETMEKSLGHAAKITDLFKPENRSYFEFYVDLVTNYRTIHIFNAANFGKGCKLSVSKAPREGGFRGIWRSTLYKIYLLASWILPNSMQDHLSYLGFPRKTMTVNCGADNCDCRQLTKQIILEKIN